MLSLQEIGKGVWQYYKGSLMKNEEPYDLPLLLAMATGELTQEVMQVELMKEFTSKGWI